MTPSLETGSQTWPTMSTRYLAKKRLLDVKPKDCKWLLYVVVAYSSMVSISFYKWIIAPPNEIEKQNHTQIIGEIHFYLLGITVLLYIYIHWYICCYGRWSKFLYLQMAILRGQPAVIFSSGCELFAPFWSPGCLCNDISNLYCYNIYIIYCIICMCIYIYVCVFNMTLVWLILYSHGYRWNWTAPSHWGAKLRSASWSENHRLNDTSALLSSRPTPVTVYGWHCFGLVIPGSWGLQNIENMYV